MHPLRRAGAVVVASLLMISVHTPRSDAYPWPKRQRVVIGQAPMAFGQAPMAFGQAPVTYGQAPVTYGQAPVAPMMVGSAPTTAYVGSAPTAPVGAAPATTLTLTPAPAGSAPTASAPAVQYYTFGSAPTGSAPGDACTLSAEDEAAIVTDLRDFRQRDLADSSSLERRRQLIEEALTILEDYCPDSNETTRRTRARQLANRAMEDEPEPGLSGAAPYAAPGVMVLPQPMYAPAPQPLYQPVIPVLLQPAPQHKCWRCLHKGFCPHKAYP